MPPEVGGPRVLVEDDLPGFVPPPPPPTPPAPDDPLLLNLSSPGDADPGDAQDPEQTTTGRSSQASTDDPPRPPIDGRVVGEVFAALLKFLSVVVHWVLAPRRPHNDVWIADDQDLAAIAPPLARIAARHIPLARFVTSDVADGLLAGAAVTAYVDKNLDAAAQLREQQPAPPDLTVDDGQEAYR
jgi:hypothetical protein